MMFCDSRRGPCGGVRGAAAALGFGAGDGGRVVTGKRFPLARQQPCRPGGEAIEASVAMASYSLFPGLFVI